MNAMETEAKRTPGTTVMVVDDELWLRRSFERILGEDGYTVVSVDSGRSALAIAASLRPELIVLDILMPDMDGLATLTELRRRGVKSVIVVLTALATVQSARQAMLLGADDFITKPFDLNVLKLVLRDGLAARRSSESEESCGL